MIELRENLSHLQLSAIRRYTNLAKQTPDCVMLTLGEPDFDTPQPIKDAAAAALAAGKTHYAPNQGIPELLQAIADFETRRGYPCEPAQVLVTAGATGALFTALTGVLNPGDELVVITPAFPLYETDALIAGAKVVKLDISKTDFRITPEALEAVITPKTKAIILNSPNNPSGTVLDQGSLDAVKAAVLGKPIYVICDNVYQQLCDGEVPDLSLDPQLRQQVLICQSFSKPYAMTGWRAGYLAGPKDVMGRLLLLNAAQITAVPVFVQCACTAALTTPVQDMADSYQRRRAYVCRRLEAMGLSFPKPEGAFYVFANIEKTGMDSDTFCTRLIREGRVATVPGACFGAEGYIRMSCACSEAELEKAMDRLEAFLKGL